MRVKKRNGVEKIEASKTNGKSKLRTEEEPIF